MFVCYLDEKPFEIFVGLDDEEIFPVPKSIIRGKIEMVKSDEGKIRFDFKYTDEYGYVKSIGGINHVFDKHAHKYSSIITKLLQKDVDLSQLADSIDDMILFQNYTSEIWKNNIKRVLEIK